MSCSPNVDDEIYIIVCIEETWISWRTSCGCHTSTRSIRAGCAGWLVVVAYVSLFCNVQQIAASARSYLKEKSMLADNLFGSIDLFGSRDLQGSRDLFGSRASKANRVPGDPYPFTDVRLAAAWKPSVTAMLTAAPTRPSPHAVFDIVGLTRFHVPGDLQHSGFIHVVFAE